MTKDERQRRLNLAAEMSRLLDGVSRNCVSVQFKAVGRGQDAGYHVSLWNLLMRNADVIHDALEAHHGN